MSNRNYSSGKFESKHNPSKDDVISFIEKCESEHGKVTRSKVISEYPVSRSNIENYFNTFSRAKKAADLDDTGRIYTTKERLNEINDECSNDEHLDSIIKGLIMGDGWVGISDGQNPCIGVGMINKEFLDYLKSMYPNFFNCVNKKHGAEESAKNMRDSGFRPETKEKDHHDFYVLRSKRLPFIKKYKSWYTNGEKKYPNDLRLDGEMVKMWYVGDGHVNHRKNVRSSISITCSNESDRLEFISGLFKEHEFSPKIRGGRRVEFLVDDSERLLEWMGTAPPGFEYKWEVSPNSRYESLKEKVYR